MSTKENRSIAYIYNEMDPSEKLEFERDLKDDNDLLIEVESFKNISKNLSKLEHIEPPAHVVDAVFESARNRPGSSHITQWRTFFYSVAAVLLVGMTSGIFLLDNQPVENNDRNHTETESAAVSGTPIFSQPVSSSSTDNPAPWVDKNDILYFHEQAGSGNQSAIDSIKNDSFRKLTPVTDPSQIRTFQRQLQLTGNHR